MSLEDTLSATLDDYDRLAPDAGEVQAWLQHRIASDTGRRVRPLAAVAAVVMVVAVAATISVLGSSRGNSTPSAASASAPFRYTAPTQFGTLIPAADRLRAENISTDLLDGTGRFTLSTLRGRVIVLTWMASWCGPCRGEYAKQLASPVFPPAGATAVTIATRDNRANAAGLFDPRTAPGPVAFDEDLATLHELGGLPTDGLPVTVLIDRQFRVAAVYPAVVDPAMLNQLVGDLKR